jgi:hypothetical protein
MNLQPAINELMTRRELIKQKLKDIEDAIPVLQRLNNEMYTPPAPEQQPIVISSTIVEKSFGIKESFPGEFLGNLPGRPIPEKTCNRCNKTKYLEEFSVHRQCIGGRANTCKECKREEDIQRKKLSKKAVSRSVNQIPVEVHVPASLSVGPPEKLAINPAAVEMTPPAAKFTCEECHCVFRSKSAFSSHNELFHSAGTGPTSTRTGMHQCGSCEKRFNTSKGLSEHRALRHPKTMEEAIDF